MKQVFIIEIGTGVDLRGQDVTKAAVRAVRDAIGTNYLPGLRALTGGDADRLEVRVRLAVPPSLGQADHEPIRAVLPHKNIAIEQVEGGLLTPDGFGEGGMICIVNAAVEVWIAP